MRAKGGLSVEACSSGEMGPGPHASLMAVTERLTSSLCIDRLIIQASADDVEGFHKHDNIEAAVGQGNDHTSKGHMLPSRTG